MSEESRIPGNPPDFQAAKQVFEALQEKICTAFQAFEHAHHFSEDEWTRAEGGGGRSRVLEGGDVIEKGGVNFSSVKGEKLPESATQHRPYLGAAGFRAAGVSVVMHPRNPYAPTSHMNVRYFETEDTEGHPVWWFGGGFDLTPFYPFREDCVAWHEAAQAACEPYGASLYPKFKSWCDRYFFLKHRNEARGIGGIFFDDFNELSFGNSLAFVQRVGEAYLAAYLRILEKRCNTNFGLRERSFQLYRRGRYVEFNLVYDRGTLFGLQSGGRTESILMSLPPVVEWRYGFEPESDTPEADLSREFLKPRDWLAEKS